MRNPRSEKIREYRKAIRGAKGYISLWKLFDFLHPEYQIFPRWHSDWSAWWDQVDNIQDDWFRGITHEAAIQHYGGGTSSPAWFRQNLNRRQRNKEKQAIRDATAGENEWEDFALPRYRRNANGLWW